MSLVEMLIVISIIGIISSIAVISFGSIKKEGADKVRDQRNAQALTSVFMGGETAGLSFYVDGDIEATVDNVIAGATVNDGGVFDGAHFSLKGIDEPAKQSAMQYLILDGGLLTYNPAGISPP
ncbi:MAG: prepilin-type N-terminal cleavage/methylation domain-containing protein [Verrucomicrobiales bacterium]|jgi:prepilin-type N-terminal cleavage/methylation domain-containing protein